MDYPRFTEPEKLEILTAHLLPPSASGEEVELEKGPNIKPLPTFAALPDTLQGPVLLKVGDNISTDEIMPAGSKVLPFRSNIPEISKFVFSRIDEEYYERAMHHKEKGSFVVGGSNYGQGSSREHAALAPRYLGLKVVLAKSFARIHYQNLANFGILALLFDNPEDYDRIEQGDELRIDDVRGKLQSGGSITVTNKSKGDTYSTKHSLTERQVEMVLEGSLINVVRKNI
jgi:aconitate hydratase